MAHLLNLLTRLIAADSCSRAALHPAVTFYVPVGAASSPGEKYPLGDMRLRGMTHHHIGAYVGEASFRVAASENQIDSKGRYDGSQPRQAVSAVDAPW
jgi:hypothetical protein